MNGNVIRTITIRGTSEGLDKLQTDLVKLAGAHKGVAIAAEETDKKTRSLEQAWKAQTLRLDEAARAQNNIARETKIANQMLHEQRISTEQHAERLNLINQRYAVTATATKEVAKQTGLARHELINLGRQAQDVGVSLASGQSLLMVAVQQGSQIADVIATSAGGLRGVATQAAGWAKAFLSSTGGIVTAVLAIGGAAVYVASQFLSSSKTVEQALAEQKRLMEENKTAVGGLIDAQIKLQTTALTRFQMLDNERDLWGKLKNAMEEAAKVAERAVTRPAQVAGEMGEAPTGLTPLKDPGYAQIAEAIQTLRAAMNDGRAGLAEFNNELGRIGEATPEVTRLVAELTSAGQQSLVLEASALKASMALKSIAQNQLNATLILESAQATERMAQATLELAALYPGMSIEVAKQLQAMEGQLQLAQARTPEEKAVVQELVTQNQLLNEGKTLEEAVAIAAQQRLITEEAITAAKANQVDYAITAYERSQGMTTTLKDQSSTSGEVLTKEEKRKKESAQTAEELERQKREYDAINDTAGEVGNQVRRINLGLNQTLSPLGNIITWTKGWLAGWKDINTEIGKAMSMLNTQFSETKGTYQYDPFNMEARRESLERRAARTGGTVESYRFGVDNSGFTPMVGYRIKRGSEANYMSDIAAQFEDNTEATKANTAATQAMTDVLSPFYSSDPRRTHLGFRAFAGGGIMTPYGSLPLKQYQGGGVANSPQVAVYGEGSTPEAYVPVPSGRIPVEIKQPANSNQRPVNVTINVMGNADANTVSALRATAFQQAQAMRRALG